MVWLILVNVYSVCTLVKKLESSGLHSVVRGATKVYQRRLTVVKINMSVFLIYGQPSM